MSDSNKNARVLTKGALLKALTDAHTKSKAKGGPDIPHSYKTLLDLEKKGVIDRASGIVRGDNEIRLYSQNEIDDIVKTIVSYKNRPKKKK